MIDKKRLWTEGYAMSVEQDSLQLIPGGYLVGIGAEVRGSFPRPLDYITFELSSWSFKEARSGPVIDVFRIPVGWGFHKGGILLDEPLENRTSSRPFMLRISEHPLLWVTQVSCWETDR